MAPSTLTVFRAAPQSPQPYIQAHEQHHTAYTLPLPIAQEGPTGTRSARRRPLATAGTLEHNSSTSKHRNGERTLRSEGPSMPQRGTASQARSNAKRGHKQEATANHRRGIARERILSRAYVHRCMSIDANTSRKLFHSSGVAASNLVRERASSDSSSRYSADARRCAFARLCDTSAAHLSTAEHDRPHCLYCRPDCSYQKTPLLVRHGGQSQGVVRGAGTLLSRRMAHNSKPLATWRTNPRDSFFGDTPVNFLERRILEFENFFARKSVSGRTVCPHGNSGLCSECEVG